MLLLSYAARWRRSRTAPVLSSQRFHGGPTTSNPRVLSGRSPRRRRATDARKPPLRDTSQQLHDTPQLGLTLMLLAQTWQSSGHLAAPRPSSRGRLAVCGATKKGTVRCTMTSALGFLCLQVCLHAVFQRGPYYSCACSARDAAIMRRRRGGHLCVSSCHARDRTPTKQVKGKSSQAAAKFISVPSLDSDGWRLQEVADIIAR